MRYRNFLIFMVAILGVGVAARDIDVENYVRKYWTFYRDRVVGNGDKRWPLTPELKAERFRHFKGVMLRFAPHIVEESYTIDRAFNWKKGTFLAIMRFSSVKSEPAAAPAAGKVAADSKREEYHECTSWVAMSDLTDGKTVFVHKNRDSSLHEVALLRRAVPGKHAWIGNGAQSGFNPTQGINDRGVVVLMNSGDPAAESDNSQYGMGTPLICRILLEESGTAEAAVELLKKIIADNAYSHAGSGSIWFIGDSKNVYIVENNARKVVAKPVNSGFDIRANAHHYPEMQKYSTRNFTSLNSHFRREFAVRDFLLNQQWRNNGILTPADLAASSRINQYPDKGAGYTPCGSKTLTGVTFAIDMEFPETLSTMYSVFGPPRSSCYIPVPMTIRDIPEEILDGSFSRKSIDLHNKNLPLLPEKELNALEERMYKRHAEALGQVRKILRTSRNHSTPQDAAKILNDAFNANWQDMQSTLKQK